ncbi:unnamed protein product [Commensalibacter communis]|uniref:Uncharacterized protein n=1 Tax=Commensalibacter communis TaxID=2972786 RepID=A0A9W4TQ49_9PROT|nr:unnamed protein product [Commensalibacter communis]CAI3956196.1 unnamed protein product [Commensalibacter communis]CAI3956585.1 unnamed protein product [Commensalibacter communis]CAI3957079.1 unnamed protein product [Commensalibacter communis]
MNDIKDDQQDDSYEWKCYFEYDYHSLQPVDVMLDQNKIVTNVILFEDRIYNPEYEVKETDRICHIKLYRIYDHSYFHITHYRKIN